MINSNDKSGGNERLSELITHKTWDQIPNPLLIFLPDNTLIFANSAASELTGYTLAELVNSKPPYPFWTKKMKDEFAENPDLELLNSYHGERLYVKKNGQPFRVKICVSICDENDTIKYFLVSWTEITSQKIAKQKEYHGEECYKQLSENGLDIVYHVQLVPEMITEFISSSVTALTGYQPEDFYADPQLIMNIVQPEDRSIWSIPPKDTSLKPEYFTTRWCGKNGQIIWMEQVNIPTYDHNNTPVALDGIARDITEKRKTEIALKESEEKLRIIFENSPAVLTLSDAEGKLLLANPAFKIVNSNSHPQSPKVLNLFDDPSIKPEEKARIKAGEAVYTESTIDFDLAKRLGTIKSANSGKRQIERVIIPLKNPENNQTSGFLVHAQDITQRKQLEERLKASEVRFRTIFEKSPIGIQLWNARGNSLVVNQASRDILGVSENVEFDNKFNLFADPNLPTDAKTRLNNGEYIKYDTVIDIEAIAKELNMKSSKKGICYTERSITALKNPSTGAITGYLEHLQDISERKLAGAKLLEIEALKKLDKTKSELLANVSHELRTPLASIKGFIETLIEPDVKWTRKRQLEFLNLANQQADHLTELIQDLLDMSRLDSGKLVLNKQPLSVSEILDSAQTILTSLTAKHQLQIRLPPETPKIQADIKRIVQVIANLVNNAVKFSEEGKPIQLSVRGTKNKVIFSVRDWGKGISEGTAGNLFNRFYQAESVVEGKTKGTGLGLAISKGIVEAHGGTIWLEKRTRHGAKFCFSLPAAAL